MTCASSNLAWSAALGAVLLVGAGAFGIHSHLESSQAEESSHDYRQARAGIYKERILRARADYGAAREKCGDLLGEPRVTCRTRARSTRAAALTAARMSLL